MTSRFLSLLFMLVAFGFFSAQLAIGQDGLGRGTGINLGGSGEPMDMDSEMGMGMEEEMYGDEMEMEEGDMYGDDSGYGGGFGGGPGGPSTSRGGRGRGRGGSMSDFIAQQGMSQLASVFGGIDPRPIITPPGEVAPADAGPVLASEAQLAYQNGNYPLALELFFGHLAVEYEKARGSLQTVQYSRLMRRPAWTVRWGVSIAVRGDGLEPNPIRASSSNQFASTGAGGLGGRGALGMQGGPGDFGQGDFGQGDGGFDQEMMQQQQSMMEEQMEDMRGMEEGMGGDPSMMGGPGGLGRGGLGGRGGPGAGRGAAAASAPAIQRDMLNSDAAETLSENLGLVAQVCAEMFDSRYRKGDFGNALTTVTAPVGGLGGSMGEGLGTALDTSPEPLPMWKPGLFFLGEGDSKSKTLEANKANIDLLLHFDVLSKQPRGQEVQTISRVRLIHVPSGKSLGTSKSFDNYEAAGVERTGRGTSQSYVSERMETFFGIVDRQAKTLPLPALTAEIAKRRVGSLLAGNQLKSLRTLAEVRLYQMQGLLTEEEVETVFDIAGAEEGLTLLHGKHEDKMRITREWAVRGVGGKTSE